MLVGMSKTAEQRERHRQAKRAYIYREKLRKRTITPVEKKWLDQYNARTKPGRPVAAPPPPPPAVKVEFLDAPKALPPHSNSTPPHDAGGVAVSSGPEGGGGAGTAAAPEAPPDGAPKAPEPVQGVVLCKVCGRPLPCPVGHAQSEPKAPPIDLPDPDAAKEEPKESGPAGFNPFDTGGGMVAMGQAMLSGFGEELRKSERKAFQVAGVALSDEKFLAWWGQCARVTEQQIARYAKEALGVSEEAVAGVVTFGVPLAAGVAVHFDAKERRAPAEPERPRPQPVQPVQVSPNPQPQAAPESSAPANGANGAQRPRVVIDEPVAEELYREGSGL